MEQISKYYSDIRWISTRAVYNVYTCSLICHFPWVVFVNTWFSVWSKNKSSSIYNINIYILYGHICQSDQYVRVDPRTKLLNSFLSCSFPGLFESTDYRTVKQWFLPLPVLIWNIQRKFGKIQRKNQETGYFIFWPYT